MTVKELIEQLQKMPQDIDVRMEPVDMNLDLGTVDKVELVNYSTSPSVVYLRQD